MKKSSILLAVIALFAGATVARAQNPTAAAPRTDSSAVQANVSPQEALDNLQKAAEDLSKAVEVAVTKIAKSPELKTAALQVAAGAVNLAQQSLAEQLKTIEAALN